MFHMIHFIRKTSHLVPRVLTASIKNKKSLKAQYLRLNTWAAKQTVRSLGDKKMLKPEYKHLLKQTFLLTQATEEAAEALLTEEWRRESFNKGQVIFGRGKNQDCLGMLALGRASARSGGALLLRSFGKGDVFGAAALFAPAIEPISEIVADSSGEILLLPAEAVRRLLGRHPQCAENYIRFLAQRIVFLNHKIEALGRGEAVKRLAVHLASSCRPDKTGRQVCADNISRLAQSLGLSRASVYRSFEQLQEAGCLHREGKNVVIDRRELLEGYRKE